MDTQEWLEKAIQKIQELPAGRSFVVRNLFEGVEWESLARGDRITFGKYFKNEVIDGRVQNVRFVERQKNNHAKYEKYEEE